MHYRQQLDSSDCGAACLAMVASHFGKSLNIAQVRATAGTDVKGSDSSSSSGGCGCGDNCKCGDTYYNYNIESQGGDFWGKVASFFKGLFSK